ncbi:MAG TPA: hypothetical protein VNK05_16375 [Chloroflexota bacterium]|nr:hypothetical protein [Chloroflexota bacterium]
MTTEPFFAVAVTAALMLFFGVAVTFGGYRFFLVLLPIFGFLFGFGLGAQTVQALFGGGFLATVTGWLAGTALGAAFAITSYLFYIGAVALVSGALGYALGVGLMEAVGFDFGFLVWLVGMIAGAVLAIAVVMLNLQKWAIIVATSALGAGIIVGTLLFVFGELPPAQLVENPVRFVLQTSPFWLIVYLTVAVVGVVLQFQLNRHLEIRAYNRVASLTGDDLVMVEGAP